MATKVKTLEKSSEDKKEPSALEQGLKKTGAIVAAVFRAVLDDSFVSWFAHGATELANMVLHGHPAPVYSRSTSPAHVEREQLPPVAQPMPQQDHSPESKQTDQAPVNVVDKHLLSPNNEPDVHTAQTVSANQELHSNDSNGVVNRHLTDLHQSPELEHDEQQLSH